MNRENNFLTNIQIEQLKNILLEKKKNILDKNKRKDHKFFCLDTNELSDLLDEVSVNVQTSEALRFRNRDLFYLKKIDHGLQRIKNHTYGICNNCDEKILFERLKARSTTDLCIICKEEFENIEKNNFFNKKSKSLGEVFENAKH